jgi:hypothetical protein
MSEVGRSTDMLAVDCSCGKRIVVPAGYAGKKVSCSACRAVVQVSPQTPPQLPSPASPQPPAPSAATADERNRAEQSTRAPSSSFQEKSEFTKLAIVCAATLLLIVAAIPILGWSKVTSIVGETTLYVVMTMAVLSIPLLIGSYYYGKQSDGNERAAKPTRPVRRSTLASAGLVGAAVLVAILLGCYFFLSRGDYQTDTRLQGVHAFEIRDVQFSARQPAQFVLLQDRDVLEQIVHPPDNELHIAFITVLDASRIMNGEAPFFDRYVTIQSNRKLDATAVTPGMFHEIKAGIKKQGFEDTIARNKRTMNDFMAATGHHVDEVRVIGFTETRDSYTLTVLVKQRHQHVRVNTVTMCNLRDCCIVVATTALCRTQDDIDWSQTAAAECASSLK